ncbi:hypothetical protein J3U21_06835 [Gilliamella sp. B2776]|uniref:hypothetical protein n=1 Tax=unclassified Gilliamella TaxID=2685620 RepID=UPI00226A4E6A|nr:MULTISPECIES: hypothetical protein [unclassified Gilliamella]MCX8650093.1 hypothetical protein [Gilliamella sp. B2779]MCX8655026.1 hypothetical protein [Gilliamella sp. B2737]MCX8656624.1 hypothetical protein [Gilliamella sp. B2894]MCX8665415.1 hypothetical protein [Gilliamella sp. B2887]MCX8691866.1 hypothetical protein [Gilliamella sp. B2776]
MWLFWLYEFLGFFAVISLIFVYCHFRDKKFWSFTWKHLKWVLLSIVGVWLIIAILCRHDLYNATHCYFRGVSMHAQTKYSIYLGECQIETPNGSYVPIDRTRALPFSNDHSRDDETDDFYPTN